MTPIQIRARIRGLRTSYECGRKLFDEYNTKKDIAYDYCKRVHEEIIELKKQLPNYKPRVEK